MQFLLTRGDIAHSTATTTTTTAVAQVAAAALWATTTTTTGRITSQSQRGREAIAIIDALHCA